MSEKQRAKHIADREAANSPETYPVSSSLLGADPTPDGLGAYEGGPLAMRGSNRWVSEKSHASRTGDSKNAPGTDYASKITHRQDSDFNEIHTDANGDFFLYNHKTDAWDIKGDSADIPYYEDENGKTFAFNYKTGEWNIPVTFEDQDAPEASESERLLAQEWGDEFAPLLIEESDNVPCDAEEFTDVNPEVVG